MWYEILPAFAIIAGAITVSGCGLKIIEYFECEGKVRFCYHCFSSSRSRPRPVLIEVTLKGLQEDYLLIYSSSYFFYYL